VLTDVGHRCAADEHQLRPEPMMATDPAQLRAFIADAARRQGFHRVGFTSVAEPRYHAAYRDWLARGHHGTMSYLARADAVEARRAPAQLLEGARAIVVVALAYPPPEPVTPAAGPPRGRIASYVGGRDYHIVLKDKLRTLAAAVSQYLGSPVAARPCVDSAPILERSLAEMAGIGFIGKNTLLIIPGLGSYVVLGELLLDVDLAPPPPAPPQARCGSCRACLDACPTAAFTAPYQLDARRCISYLTIEHRGSIAPALRPALGNHVFGCDICQSACPYNAAAPARWPAAPELAPRDPRDRDPELAWLAGLGANQRRRHVEGTALRRVNREQLLRNVCIALGNSGEPGSVAPLIELLADRSPLVRGHAAWALGRLGQRAPLVAALAGERDPGVRSELSAALQVQTDPDDRR
jgi:epoxyqueuosine reductase